MHDLSSQTLPSNPTLRQLLDGYRISQLLYVVAELGIADLLKEGPRHYQDLAEASGAHPQALFRVLRGLASIGVFTRVDADHFALNDPANALVSDAPNSLHAAALAVGTQYYSAWGNLLHTVRTGETAFDALHGKSIWEHRSEDPRAGKIFNTIMSRSGMMRMDRVVEGYDWSRFKTIVDVGGGQGALLASILNANPSVHGILYDLPAVVSSVHPLLEQANIADRCEVVAGSFLDYVPMGGDLYLVSRILHDWHDDRVAQILSNCRSAMQAGTTLVLAERVLDPVSATPEQAFGDLTMMVMNGGRERTAAEFQELLSSAGFSLLQVIPTAMPFQLIEAVAI